MPNKQQEAVVFGLHMLRQILYAFARLDAIGDEAAPGSPMIAFYLNGIYDRLAAMFLLDRDGNPTGGLFSRVYIPLGMGHCLDDMYGILAHEVGQLTLGETVRRFRNKVLVHGALSDDDLESIYKQADMLDPGTMAQFHEGLHAIRDALPHLALCLCIEAGIKPEGVGIHPID